MKTQFACDWKGMSILHVEAVQYVDLFQTTCTVANRLENAV